MKIHFTIFENRCQIEILNVHGEFVSSELNDVGAVDKEFLSIFQLPDCILFDRFKPALDVINANIVFKLS